MRWIDRTLEHGTEMAIRVLGLYGAARKRRSIHIGYHVPLPATLTPAAGNRSGGDTSPRFASAARRSLPHRPPCRRVRGSAVEHYTDCYKESVMKRTIAMTCLVVGTLLGPVVALAADDRDADRSRPAAFVKDSAITTMIKAKLAAEHMTSLGRIHVDTDK